MLTWLLYFTQHLDLYDNCDGSYDVTFKPLQAGIHSIWVSNDGQLLAGCPTQIDIEEGKFSIGDILTLFQL